MITQEFLSQCSDEQINKGAAWLEASKANIKRHGFFIASKHYCNRITMGCAMFSFEPCANPNDIMPIAFANRIDIKHDYDVLESVTALIGNEDDYLYWATNTNPLRAICEVYILMSVNK
jgi:hypothetical protein